MSDIENDKQQLIAKRDELIARLEAIEQNYRRGLDSDAEERAVQLENADVEEAIAKSTAEELQRIEQLLEKLG